MCSCGSYNPENFQLYMVRLAHQIQCIHISPILNEDPCKLSPASVCSLPSGTSPNCSAEYCYIHMALSTTFVLHAWHLNQFRHITKPLSNIIMPFVFLYYRTRSAQSEKAHFLPSLGCLGQHQPQGAALQRPHSPPMQQDGVQSHKTVGGYNHIQTTLCVTRWLATYYMPLHCIQLYMFW